MLIAPTPERKVIPMLRFVLAMIVMLAILCGPAFAQDEPTIGQRVAKLETKLDLILAKIDKITPCTCSPAMKADPFAASERIATTMGVPPLTWQCGPNGCSLVQASGTSTGTCSTSGAAPRCGPIRRLLGICK